MATSRGRGRPRLLSLNELKARNAAEFNKEEMSGRGNSLRKLQQRYANKLKRERIYVK